MEKILKDRLNHLKSDLAILREPKLGKSTRGSASSDPQYILAARIEEVEWLLKKITRKSKKDQDDCTTCGGAGWFAESSGGTILTYNCPCKEET